MEGRISAAVGSQNSPELTAILRELTNPDRTALDAAQTSLGLLCAALDALPAEQNEWVTALSEEAVAALRGRLVEFEHADFLFRKLVMSCCWGVRAHALGARAAPPRPPARRRRRRRRRRRP